MTITVLPDAILAQIGPIQRMSYPPQGATSAVAIAETAHGAYVIKRALGVQYGGWLAQEYRVLTALAGQALPIPQPHQYVRNDNGVRPERWLVMDYLPGQPLASVLNSAMNLDRRAVLLRSFGSTLAAIHALALPTGLPAHTPTWLDYMLEEAAENLEHFSVDGTPQLLERLRSYKPAQVRQTVIHGDYTINNVLVDGERVSGIIDWSGGAVGDPRYDLALATRPQQEAFGAHRATDLQAFFAGYGTAPLTQEDSDYFIGLYEFF